MTKLGSKDSSRNVHQNYAINFFYLPTFSTLCMCHLLYLIFRCDGDVMKSLEFFLDLNTPCVALGTCLYWFVRTRTRHSGDSTTVLPTIQSIVLITRPARGMEQSENYSSTTSFYSESQIYIDRNQHDMADILKQASRRVQRYSKRY